MDETNHTASVFTKEIWLYINFVKIADSKIPCKLFVPTSKSFQSYHAWYEEGGLNMEVGYSCKRKWEWEYIKNYYYSMTILPRSTNSIGWQLYLLVKDAENSVYGNMMQLLIELIWFHPLRFPKVVCRQTTHWGKLKGLLQNHLTKITNKITKNTISINFENNKKSGPIMFNNNYLIISSQCYIHCS